MFKVPRRKFWTLIYVSENSARYDKIKTVAGLKLTL